MSHVLHLSASPPVYCAHIKSLHMNDQFTKKHFPYFSIHLKKKLKPLHFCKKTHLFSHLLAIGTPARAAAAVRAPAEPRGAQRGGPRRGGGGRPEEEHRIGGASNGTRGWWLGVGVGLGWHEGN